MPDDENKKKLTKKPPNPENWFSRIGSLIVFVNVRRRDERWPVWPWKQLAAILAVIVPTVLLTMFVVDPHFLALIRQDDFSSAPALQYFTVLGKSNWILITSGSLVIAMSLLSANRVRGRLYAVWNRVFFTVWFAFFSIAVSGIAAIIFKFLLGRIRPSYNIGNSALEFSYFTSNYVFNSFPSGHSTTAGAMAIIMALLLPRWRWSIIAAWLFVAATRALIGAHFPSDVIAGVTLGMVVTWVYARSMARRRILFEFDKNGRLQLRRPQFAPFKLIPKMLKQALSGNAHFPADAKPQKG